METEIQGRAEASEENAKCDNPLPILLELVLRIKEVGPPILPEDHPHLAILNLLPPLLLSIRGARLRAVAADRIVVSIPSWKFLYVSVLADPEGLRDCVQTTLKTVFIFRLVLCWHDLFIFVQVIEVKGSRAHDV